jgi:hypothetical protein
VWLGSGEEQRERDDAAVREVSGDASAGDCSRRGDSAAGDGFAAEAGDAV